MTAIAQCGKSELEDDDWTFAGDVDVDDDIVVRVAVREAEAADADDADADDDACAARTESAKVVSVGGKTFIKIGGDT